MKSILLFVVILSFYTTGVEAKLISPEDPFECGDKKAVNHTECDNGERCVGILSWDCLVPRIITKGWKEKCIANPFSGSFCLSIMYKRVKTPQQQVPAKKTPLRVPICKRDTRMCPKGTHSPEHGLIREFMGGLTCTFNFDRCCKEGYVYQQTDIYNKEGKCVRKMHERQQNTVLPTVTTPSPARTPWEFITIPLFQR